MLIVISMRGDAGEWNDAQVPMGRVDAGDPATRSASRIRDVESADAAATTVQTRRRRPRFGTRTPRAVPLCRAIVTSNALERVESMNRLEATRVVVELAGEGADRREPRPSRLRPVRRRRPSAELLHLGQHGRRLVDRPRSRAGAP